MSAWNDHSLWVAMQTAFGTANVTDNNFQPLLAEVPSVSFETEVSELDLMTGQVGAAPERIVGRRSGTLSFSIPLEGFVSGYDPTGENPGGVPAGSDEVIPIWFALLANAMGSNNSAASSNSDFFRGLMCSVSQYTSAGMASGTASSIVCDDATASNKISVGQLVVAALSATNTSPQAGWVKTKAVQTLTLFEAAKNNVNDNAAHLYGTATAYASSEVTSTKPLSFRWTGPDATLCYDLIDAICQSVKITWESGSVPTAEFSYKFYDYRLNKADGGLGTPASYTRIPQLVGSLNGTATVGGSNQCGLESCSWEWSATVRETKCHGAESGITSVEVIKPRIKVGFTIPHDTADVGYDSSGSPSAGLGQHIWQSALELGTRKSIGVYVGSNVGRIWSFLIPSGLVVSVPQVSLRDSTVAYQLEVEAASYTGDTTDTAETTADSPIDSVARVALG